MDGTRYLEDGRLTIFKRSGVFYARIGLSASGRYTSRQMNRSERIAKTYPTTSIRIISSGSDRQAAHGRIRGAKADSGHIEA